MPHTLGILSGLDQKSTAPFIDAFLKEYEKPFLTKGEIEISRILVHALPSTTGEYSIADAKKMLDALVVAAKTLERDGARCIVVTSILAHIHLPDIQRSVTIPVLDMVALTLQRIKKAPYKIAVLGSRVTIGTQLFQNALAQLRIEGIMPPYWQTHVDGMLKKIKVGLSAQTEFNWLLGRIKSSGMTTIIVASTELSKPASKATGFTILDTNTILAEEAVRICRT